MHRSLLAAILVSFTLLATQPPVLSTLFPVPNYQTIHLISGSTDLVVWQGLLIWDGIPTGYFTTLGLFFLLAGMAGELKHEPRRNNEPTEKEEISLA
jgi:hypothetical protein